MGVPTFPKDGITQTDICDDPAHCLKNKSPLWYNKIDSVRSEMLFVFIKMIKSSGM